MEPENVFNTKGFLRQVEEEVKPLMKTLCKTQMFSHFIHDAYEYDDNYEVQVFTDVMKLAEELLHGELSVALDIPKDEVKDYIHRRVAEAEAAG